VKTEIKKNLRAAEFDLRRICAKETMREKHEKDKRGGTDARGGRRTETCGKLELKGVRKVPVDRIGGGRREKKEKGETIYKKRQRHEMGGGETRSRS